MNLKQQNGQKLLRREYGLQKQVIWALDPQGEGSASDVTFEPQHTQMSQYSGGN